MLDPEDPAPLFPGERGEEWTANAFEKWRQRRFSVMREGVGLPGARPYDLRHSFASLLLHEGRDVIYVARQLGHGAELTLRTYGRVISELEDARQQPAEETIRLARAAVAASAEQDAATEPMYQSRTSSPGAAAAEPDGLGSTPECPDLDSNQGPTP
jgi:hypothetical protein